MKKKNTNFTIFNNDVFLQRIKKDTFFFHHRSFDVIIFNLNQKKTSDIYPDAFLRTFSISSSSALDLSLDRL